MTRRKQMIIFRGKRIDNGEWAEMPKYKGKDVGNDE